IEAKRIADYIVFFYASGLQAHFKLEEEYVFSLLPKNNELRVKAEAQHSKLKELVDILKLTYNADILLQFAELLEQHIRFEERELFNFIEVNASSELLLNAASAISNYARNDKANWNDEFWAKTY
ncbi:MAG: hemerythrin domain-containing protein, partial [Bacteroidetes bacterium]|nr:hemerythrin domain-containing protein [Bacteroidota bacterium]